MIDPDTMGVREERPSEYALDTSAILGGSVSGNAKWPLTANIWPQSTSATDLLYGEATVRFPTTCTSSDPNYPAYGHVDVLLDNEFVGGAYFAFYPGARYGLVHPVDAADQGGFPAAGGADDGRHLLVGNVE